MKIELHQIPIREVIADYKDNAEEGVTAYNGKLDIRPKYQREFIYKEKQRNAVIETIKKGFPLNVMYWVKTDQGNFEVMDGQQRLDNNTAKVTYRNKSISLHVPLSALGNPDRILIAAKTSRAQVPFDWVAWRILNLSADQPTR